MGNINSDAGRATLISLLSVAREKYRRFISSLLMTSNLVLFVSSAYIAQTHAALATATPPSDNDYLKAQLNTLTGSSLGFLAVGLVPFYNISLPAEIATYGLDLGGLATTRAVGPASLPTLI